MKIKEFIECPNIECNIKMRFDEGDQDYFCASCGVNVKPIVTENIEEEMRENGERIPFIIGD